MQWALVSFCHSVITVIKDVPTHRDSASDTLSAHRRLGVCTRSARRDPHPHRLGGRHQRASVPPPCFKRFHRTTSAATRVRATPAAMATPMATRHSGRRCQRSSNPATASIPWRIGYHLQLTITASSACRMRDAIGDDAS